MDRAKEAPAVAEVIMEITQLLNICFKQMKDGCISKLAIIKAGHWATQYKKTIDTLPILCADKNFRYIDNVLCAWTNLQEVTILPRYPNPDQWSNTYSVEIETVNSNAVPDQVTYEHSVIISLE